MELITICKTDRKLKGEISLPSSKSISNRVLIIRALSKKNFNIRNLSRADDTKLMQSLLDKIEYQKNISEAVELNCENAGTVMRFLTAYLSNKPGKWLLTGTERMKQRPIGILADVLRQIGVNINYVEKKGYPPILIEGSELTGGKIEIDAGVSSQFITALLLIAPALSGGLEITLINKISSLSYIEMTIKLMEYFGIKINHSGNAIAVKQQEYREADFNVEPDWTSASYWYEMAAFADEVDLTITGLKKESLQGDSVLPEIFKKLGVRTEFLNEGIRLYKDNIPSDFFEYDFTNFPDLAQSVIVTCAGLNISGKFTGLESLCIKETDRLTALQTELKKIGINTKITSNSELITLNSKQQTVNSKPINTYGDHRMAMAFAPLALLSGSIQIENPEVVSKSYPGFWEDLKKFGFKNLLSTV
ncbi:MAG: 3-phosphoshikimate 1-carboxyvinyltransferase [Bacteroidetes bacterium]|nr:3-phosphoshikimate 1-carboxyvinyltransferase [Bacteroidota bacterium]MBL7104030.1 3-phosphoshikimate 1-carboxyvinyltransferase [Bacteroidales bacterium]